MLASFDFSDILGILLLSDSFIQQLGSHFLIHNLATGQPVRRLLPVVAVARTGLDKLMQHEVGWLGGWGQLWQFLVPGHLEVLAVVAIYCIHDFSKNE